MNKTKKNRRTIFAACVILALMIGIMGTALAATQLVVPGYSGGPGQVNLSVPTVFDGQGVIFHVSRNYSNQQFDITLYGDEGYRDPYATIPMIAGTRVWTNLTNQNYGILLINSFSNDSFTIDYDISVM